MAQPERATRNEFKLSKELREWAVTLLVALLVFVPIHFFVFTMIQVDGSSMAETLHDGERLAVTLFDYRLGEPQRQDVVICHYPNRKDKAGRDINFVKRVIGLPGETIECRDGVTYIDGVALDEPYIEHVDRTQFGPFVIPEDHYFVMGDNRDNSTDSRTPRVGALERSAIFGKARLIGWPLNRFQVIG